MPEVSAGGADPVRRRSAGRSSAWPQAGTSVGVSAAGAGALAGIRTPSRVIMR